jgi:hypothetical protein
VYRYDNGLPGCSKSLTRKTHRRTYYVLLSRFRFTYLFIAFLLETQVILSHLEMHVYRYDKWPDRMFKIMEDTHTYLLCTMSRFRFTYLFIAFVLETQVILSQRDGERIMDP